MQFFSELMAEALYGDKGYYRALRVGKEGDFYTSVSVGELFGYTLGFAIANSHQRYGYPLSVVEIGAEKGYWVGDMVKYCLKYVPEVLQNLRFFVVEPLEELRELQRKYFCLQGIDPYIKILESYSVFDAPLFVSNELFDAIPCDLIYNDKVAVFHGGHLCFLSPQECKDEQYAQKLLQIAQQFQIQKGEISLQVPLLLQNILSQQKDWGFLIFDYGDDYFRNEFSMRFFKDHQPFCLDDFMKNPMEFIGVADMTYDVPFNYLDVLFSVYAAKRYHFYRQNRALMCLGIGNVFEKMAHDMNVNTQDYIRLSNMFKTLMTPSLLGDRFKCALYGTNSSLQNFFEFSF